MCCHSMPFKVRADEACSFIVSQWMRKKEWKATTTRYHINRVWTSKLGQNVTENRLFARNFHGILLLCMALAHKKLMSTCHLPHPQRSSIKMQLNTPSNTVLRLAVWPFGSHATINSMVFLWSRAWAIETERERERARERDSTMDG